MLKVHTRKKRGSGIQIELQRGKQGREEEEN